MPVTAKLNYLRIAPRKVRLAADLIRGKSVKEAESLLNFAVKKSSLPLAKLLKQAVISAQNLFQLEPDNLYISKIMVDEGPKFKRWRARSKGQAYEIQKKSSHIILVLEEKTKTKKKAKVKKPLVEKAAEVAKEEKKPLKTEKTLPDREKFRPKFEEKKPRGQKGMNRIFRRKAF
ncbi:MAG: 50S ribosomal protein L22 [Candidatus Nealsonbacteria bacterium RBG_13_38_11]|uniref:Large ribosomal subunit protein uL22 n=1 Tax=Candidatus Nealsonbacteria bacterium RBG_13_38_11 TaxID=1801662 RepID=A0A1G2DZI8_9BACT|nr:MAG: 50S ribosomal protein L22 [Candidatus Nealsonbacteria bacterium RBG_13_38_11]HXK32040.1 50S ribosomal protein L22 [Candidatus Paceibacterota bacterium]